MNVQPTSVLMHLWIPRWASWTLRSFCETVNQEVESNIASPLRGTYLLCVADDGLKASCVLGDPLDDVDHRIVSWIRKETASRCSMQLDEFVNNEYPPDEVYKKSQMGDAESLEARTGFCICQNNNDCV